ncbi:MAG: hypothetical protein R2733_10705 [Acidimicrobiales bacterium]
MTSRAASDSLLEAEETDLLVAMFGRAPEPVYDDNYIRRLLGLLADRGIVSQVEKWRKEEHPPAGPGGRPPRVSTAAMLLGLLLGARDSQGALLNNAARLLGYRLSSTMQEELGLERGAGEDDDRYITNLFHSLRRRFHEFVVPLDSSPFPKNRGDLTLSEIAGLVDTRPIDGLDTNNARLVWVTNQIIEVSWATLPRQVRRKWDGSIGIDATFVRTWAKGSMKPRDLAGADPDAGWYTRTVGGYIPGVDAEAKGKAIKTAKYGYDLTIAISSDPFCIEERHFPRLVVGMSLDRPAVGVAENAMAILNDARERGMPAGLLAGDRAYNNSVPSKFQLPATQLGYQMAFDYKYQDLGLQDSYAGAIQVDGQFYCSAMPPELITASIDYRAKADQPNKISWAVYQMRLNARVPYEMRIKEQRLGANGEPKRIMVCPAAGPSPTIGHCSIKRDAREARGVGSQDAPTSGSQSRARRNNLRILSGEPYGAVCTNLSSTVFPAAAGAKHGQDLRFGTAQWQESYGVLRNSVEGLNGLIETEHGLEVAHKRRVRGRAAVAVLLAIQLWAVNMSRIASWLADARRSDEPGLVGLRRYSGKRRPSFERYRKNLATERPARSRSA